MAQAATPRRCAAAGAVFAAATRSGLSLVWKIVLVVELMGLPNERVSKSISRSSCSTRCCSRMRCPSPRSCSSSKCSWCNPLNVMSLAGDRARLEARVARKTVWTTAGQGVDAYRRSFLALIGPSGGGKSTPLEGRQSFLPSEGCPTALSLLVDVVHAVVTLYPRIA